MNVVAKWNRNTYTVTFKENDGSSMRLMAVKHNDTVDTYPVPSMIPSGKMFDSWKIEGTNTNIGRSHRFTENTTLVPSFKDLENVAVVVEVNDSDMGTASVQTPGEQFLAGSTVAISATPKVGYKFVNWTGTSGHIGYIQSGSSDTNNITILLP